MMFARLEFRRFLVCCSGDISDDESEEKPSVAICGGSICILTGLIMDYSQPTQLHHYPTPIPRKNQSDQLIITQLTYYSKK